MRNLFITILAIFQTSCIFANAGLFGGFGSSLTLESSEDIQMASEDVRIKLVPSRLPVTGNLKNLDEARYECFFVMRNLSSKRVKVQTGFPIASGDNVMLRNSYNIVGKHEFKVFVDGTEVPVKYGAVTADGKFKSIFLWDMEFAPKAEVNLKVSYKVLGYIGVGITQRRPFNWKVSLKYADSLQECLLQHFEYITLTGNSWRGEIERAKFSIDVGDFERYLDKRGYLAEDKSSPYYEREKNSPLRYGMLYRNVSPDGWKLSGDGERIEYEFAPYKPSQNISIGYYFTSFPKDVRALDNLFKSFDAKNSKLGKSSKKIIADTILEYYGVKTGNPALVEFLKYQIWYPVKNPPPLNEDLRKKLLEFSAAN